MHRNSNRVMFVVGGLILGLLYGVCMCRINAEKVRSGAQHGRYSAQDILGLADRLGPIVSPEAEIQIESADFVQICNSQRAFSQTWNVACVDSRGDDVAYLMWNAATGRLIQVARIMPARQGAPDEIVSSEAIKIGADWLVRLGMVDPHASWRLVAPPQRQAGVWHIAFQAGKGRTRQKACVVIDARNASLILARAW